MSARIQLLSVVLAMASGLGGASGAAQSLRDPTKPPAGFGVSVADVAATPAAIRFEQLVMINGVRYVVANSRRYAVGETVDGMRIERIADDSVWVRVNGATRKMELFSGIDKRPLIGNTTANAATIGKADAKTGTTK